MCECIFNVKKVLKKLNLNFEVSFSYFLFSKIVFYVVVKKLFFDVLLFSLCQNVRENERDVTDVTQNVRESERRYVRDVRQNLV